MARDGLVSYADLVARMQGNLSAAGKMCGLSLAALEREADKELAIKREAYADSLRNDWEFLFPTVEFSETALENQLSNYLKGVRSELIARTRQELKRVKVVEVMRGWFFRKPLAYFLGGITLSCVTFPISFLLFFGTSDAKMFSGFVMFLATLALLVLLSWNNARDYRAKRKENCS